MIEFIKKNRSIIILILVFIILIVFFLLRNYISNKRFNDKTTIEYQMVPKTYEVNEYVSLDISDSDMATIYYNDYIKNMYIDLEGSYLLLDSEYRNAKFGSVDSYIKYMNTLEFGKVEKYYKHEKDDYIIYGVYDNYNNLYIFKTKGVMQYSVYLDDYTIEIW